MLGITRTSGLRPRWIFREFLRYLLGITLGILTRDRMSVSFW